MIQQAQPISPTRPIPQQKEEVTDSETLAMMAIGRRFSFIGGGNNKKSKSTGTKKSDKVKSVRFASKTKTDYVESRKLYTTREKNATWFTKREKQRSKTEVMATVSCLGKIADSPNSPNANGVTNNNNNDQPTQGSCVRLADDFIRDGDKVYCCRGILSPAEGRRQNILRKESIQVVLRAQQDYKNNKENVGTVDNQKQQRKVHEHQQHICDAYSKAARPSKRTAWQRGVKDYFIAHKTSETVKETTDSSSPMKKRRRVSYPPVVAMRQRQTADYSPRRGQRKPDDNNQNSIIKRSPSPRKRRSVSPVPAEKRRGKRASSRSPGRLTKSPARSSIQRRNSLNTPNELRRAVPPPPLFSMADGDTSGAAATTKNSTRRNSVGRTNSIRQKGAVPVNGQQQAKSNKLDNSHQKTLPKTARRGSIGTENNQTSPAAPRQMAGKAA